jgi:long-chain acyl-CoA synthetase
MTGHSIPSALLERARRDPDTVAMRVKRRGIYRDVTWAEYVRQVEAVCFGFRALGLAPGDRVAILGDPCPEWLQAEMGTLAAGAICFGIYPTSSPAQVASLLKHGGASIAVVRDQESADKILDLADAPESLRHIVVIDPQGMLDVSDPRVLSFDAMTRLPREAGASPDVHSFEALVAALDPDAPALIVFTSGTTGDPRGAVHSHRTLLAGAHDYRECLLPDATRSWRTVCHLPLNHIFEQFNTVMLPLLAPVIPHFGERRAQATATIFEVAPDFYASVPRYWQKMASQILVGMEGSSPAKRAVYGWAMKTGRRVLRARAAGRSPAGLRFLGWIAMLVAFRPLLDKLGLRHVRVGIGGGGPMPPDVQRLWQVWGVNLKNLYGQTEAGFVAVQREDFPAPGSVGTAAPGATLRLAPDGEILVNGAGSFVGYWRDEAATREMKQGDWVSTGDLGALDAAGNLVIVDRKRDIIITQGGKNIAPQAIEDRLRASPYVAEAVVFGEGRKYLSALFEIDDETVSQWARSRGLTYGGFADLAAAPEVRNLIHELVNAVNLELARPEQVKAFRILSRSLDPELEGEPVTPTRKVKRKQMLERFRHLVESMYAESEETRISEQVASIS